MEKQQVQLAAFDLDGTLLQDNKTVSPGNLRALEQAAEAGVHLVPATGRLVMGLPPQVAQLPFVRYIIASNGAEVYDTVEKRTLYAAELNEQESRRMMDYMEQLPAIRGYYHQGAGWMPWEDYQRMEEFASGILLANMRRVYTPVKDIRETLLRRHPAMQKLQVYLHTPEEKQRVLADMLQRFPDYAVTSSININIEVNALHATKGAALRFLADHLGIGLEHCMAFGDGSNDITMLKAAGIGVAMGNAGPQVKAAADLVTATNEEDGLAQALLARL